jgi:hypothetical protein
MNDRWLLEYSADRNSQSGEDGIIEKILEFLGEPTRWCVEFGAWDGRYLSNTYDLIANKGYSAVMIEGSSTKFRDLADNFKDNPNTIPINAFVGFTESDGLDSILAGTEVPEDFDVLSIDIDGNDFHVWKAVTKYRPRLVVIEYNPTVPSAVDFVQPADMSVNQGAGILSLTRLAHEKNYELICVTDHNCLFVRSEYFDRFDIEDNSVRALRPDESLVTYVFNGYDGTVFVRGYGRLAWHALPYRESKMQLVPRLLRKFPSNYSPVVKKIAKLYRSLKKPRVT